MDTMAPNVARLNNGWSVYPGSGCWVAKDGEEEMLRLSSTKVADYGFVVGEMESEDWEPGQEILPIATATTYGPTNYYNNAAVDYTTKSSTGFVGLANQGATCYLNSLLQSLYMTPELRCALYSWQWTAGRDPPKEECIPYQLQRLFVNLQVDEGRAVGTAELTKSFGWSSSDAFAQQDVQEMFNLLCQALETTFAKTPQEGLIKALYEGTVKDYVCCKSCLYEGGAGVTAINDINIDLREFGSTETIASVEEGLRKYFASEVLDGDNQYDCSKCKQKADATKGVALNTVPYILSLQLKRFTYDWELDRRVKLDDRVEFPLLLDIAPFLEAEAGRAAGGAKAGAGKEAEAAPARNGFGSGGTHLGAAGKQAEMLYELFAILMHRGSAGFGHYYAYIKDMHTNKWFEFNDATITALTEADILQAYGGPAAAPAYSAYASNAAASSASAYMLMYRRRAPEQNIMEIPPAAVPQSVLDEIQGAAAAAAAKKQEEDALKAQFKLNFYHGERVACLSLEKHTSWGEAAAAAFEQLGLDPGLFTEDMSRARCLVMRLADDMGDELFAAAAATPLPAVKHVKPYSPTDVLVEVKAAHEEWPPCYGAMGSTDYCHHRVLKLAAYQPAGDGGRMSPWKAVKFGWHATLGDVRAAAADAFGVASGAQLVKLGYQGARTELADADEVKLSDLAYPRNISSGDRINVRSLYDPTFSRTVRRLYGGAKG
jgi:ubiquitin C-terminal hydrolase